MQRLCGRLKLSVRPFRRAVKFCEHAETNSHPQTLIKALKASKVQSKQLPSVPRRSVTSTVDHAKRRRPHCRSQDPQDHLVARQCFSHALSNCLEAAFHDKLSTTNSRASVQPVVSTRVSSET